MPLIELGSNPHGKTADKRPAIVFCRGRESAAILVDSIIDIVEQAASLELSAGKPGCIGTAILKGKATEIIDPAYYLDEDFDCWFTDHAPAPRIPQEKAA